MANALTPLSNDQILNLISEIKNLEAEFQNETEPKVDQQKLHTLPTSETFDKAEVLQCLRMIEPNSVVFFQDVQKLVQIHLCANLLYFEPGDAEQLKQKYFLDENNTLYTLWRIAAVFPSLTCNFLKCDKSINRPIPEHYLSDDNNEDYPRQMTTRCIFSLIPSAPMLGKLKLIEAALLYQLLEQSKFNTIRKENGELNYAEHMRICVAYCSEDYLCTFESNEKRIQQFHELELYKFGYPLPAIYGAAKKLKAIVGNGWENEIILKFQLSGIDL